MPSFDHSDSETGCRDLLANAPVNPCRTKDGEYETRENEASVLNRWLCLMENAVIAIGLVLIIAGMGYWHDQCCTRLIDERNEAQDEVRKLKSLLALSNEPDTAMAFAVWLNNGFEEMKRQNIDIDSLITAERSKQQIET